MSLILHCYDMLLTTMSTPDNYKHSVAAVCVPLKTSKVNQYKLL